MQFPSKRGTDDGRWDAINDIIFAIIDWPPPAKRGRIPEAQSLYCR